MSAISTLRTPLTDLLSCRYPILQAGMGGVARADLVAAVVEQGAYGFLGMVRESPELILCEIARVRERSDRPFGVNLIPAGTDRVLLDEELEPLALFAGQIAGAIQDIPSAGELVQRMVREAQATLKRLGHLQ